MISRSLAALLAAALLVGACSSDPETKAAKPTESATSAAPTPTPTPTPTSLLAGRVGLMDGPLLAVKIDNTAKAHPQRGLTKADVVYITQVEGGVTRLVALYSSVLPNKVGPIRSARITDIDLLDVDDVRLGQAPLRVGLRGVVDLHGEDRPVQHADPARKQRGGCRGGGGRRRRTRRRWGRFVGFWLGFGGTGPNEEGGTDQGGKRTGDHPTTLDRPAAETPTRPVGGVSSISNVGGHGACPARRR